MRWNDHFRLEGKHAFLSPSQYHWIRYDDEKLDDRFMNHMASMIGTRKHALASEAIRLGIRLSGNKSTMAKYVNECIGFRMVPEQTLYYSDNCFGTADAIGFNAKHMKLLIFDLKTGETPAKVDQLLVYAALFCLEYGFSPFDLTYDLRIYQLDTVIEYEVDSQEVKDIMDKIVIFDKRITYLREEAGQ